MPVTTIVLSGIQVDSVIRWSWVEVPDIPSNAIYANGDPIPDPSGTGYLTYEV